MVILLDCRPLEAAGGQSEQWRWLRAMAASLTKYKRVGWVFLTEDDVLPLPEGQRVKAGRGWWLIPRLVRRYRVDLVMSTGGKPLSTKTRQCGWVWDRKEAMKMAERGIVLGCREGLGEGVRVILPAPDEEIRPLSMDERDVLKDRVADGREYFYADISDIALDSVIFLLKAFSLFKKRQLSNMVLVLAGGGHRKLEEKLESYKYRQDVRIRNGREKGEAEAAYALIDAGGERRPGLGRVNAWKSGVPVIGMEEGVADPAALAEMLKLMYKDERARKERIDEGRVRAEGLSGEQTAAGIWKAIAINQ